ncbi:hypothetical protein CDAR_407791 [Caerostris darwini]|uniref:Uncharacterized protein n=1 Tax=Caerostris darwini TaxID=1538125 RepID=A0AAV4T8J4_9ARAC|nr:hypothetical protein CDAR_407791 [Caerostris darwini]
MRYTSIKNEAVFQPGTFPNAQIPVINRLALLTSNRQRVLNESTHPKMIPNEFVKTLNQNSFLPRNTFSARSTTSGSGIGARGRRWFVVCDVTFMRT